MRFHRFSIHGHLVSMTYLFFACVLFSSFSFIGYSISYFVTPHMKGEFERFNLKHLGLFIIVLEILGALGLLAGLYFKPLLLLASGGLSLLMFLGFLIRFKLKDSLLVSLPALFYMFLNGFIFYWSFNS